MGMIYLYTGEGGGKTTNALGMALRTVGHEKRAVIIQFMKWWEKTGEYKVKDRLSPYYEIMQFGRKGWKGFKNLNEEDEKLAREGLEYARKVMLEEKPHLLVLDEINLAVDCNLLDEKEVLDFLDEIPKETTVVLTGRRASKALIDKADFVNEINDTKHPEEFETLEGIHF